METRVIEQFVVQFPAVAAWLIVALLAALTGGAALMGRRFMARLDTQDNTLIEIKNLLASEIGKLRELHHDIDKRVVRLEAVQSAEGVKYGRRADDHFGGQG